MVEFFWDGNNSWLSRSRAATDLRNLLYSLTQDGWQCHVIAHSHGGNVVLEALNYHTFDFPTPDSGTACVVHREGHPTRDADLTVQPTNRPDLQPVVSRWSARDAGMWASSIWAAFSADFPYLYPGPGRILIASLGWFALLGIIALGAAVRLRVLSGVPAIGAA